MTGKNFAISVIIPLYNAENFIGECLTSLAEQTFQDFEIIVVDDCSTDNSLRVAASFYENFGDKLKVAKLSANSGCPGISRNFALEMARGEYVYFLDSDDFLSETAFEELYTVAKKFDADVVHAEWFIVFRNVNGKFKFEKVNIQEGNFVTEPTLETFDLSERVTAFAAKKYLWWACNKLFRRQFLLENKITFPEVSAFEDMAFTFMCIVTAKNYVRVPFASYCYRRHDKYISLKDRGAVGSTNVAIKIVNTLDNFMDGQKFFRDNPQYKYAILDSFLQDQLDGAANTMFINTSHGALFNFFRDNIFSVNPKENVALTLYLFIAASTLKSLLNQQATEINKLKNQIAVLKK